MNVHQLLADISNTYAVYEMRCSSYADLGRSNRVMLAYVNFEASAIAPAPEDMINTSPSALRPILEESVGKAIPYRCLACR